MVLGLATNMNNRAIIDFLKNYKKYSKDKTLLSAIKIKTQLHRNSMVTSK